MSPILTGGSMKIITLNVWGGRIYKPLLEFIQRHKDVDIFCFQEMYHDAEGKEPNEKWKNEGALHLLTDIEKLLPEHKIFFRPHFDDFWGLSLFVKNSLPILEEGELFIHKHKGYVSKENEDFLPKNLQYLKTRYNDRDITIINVHGLWNGQGKTDTEDRIDQSKKIIDFAKNISHDFVLCGDFNLLPETQSLRMIEKELGLRNLIVEYSVSSTRTSIYKKPVKFADYIFVTPNIHVSGFKVLPDEVSDHAALFLEIGLK